MNDIIKVNYDSGKPLVSGRELHEALGIETPYRLWFPRMCEYGFIEGEDFYSKMSKTSEIGGRPAKDYEISLNMAKEICMIQRTPEGKKVRLYLIDLERAWNTPEQVMARALRIADETIKSLTVDVERMRPKAEYFDELVDRNLLTSFRDTAKELGIKERDFIAFLIDRKYIYRDKKNKLKPFADKNRGLFEVKEYNAKFSEHAGLQTLITPKGRETFRLLLKTGI
jgi:anti-repressor protein